MPHDTGGRNILTLLREAESIAIKLSGRRDGVIAQSLMLSLLLLDNEKAEDRREREFLAGLKP